MIPDLELIANKFQSTLPAGGATTTRCLCAPRGQHFNPRSPRGERHYEAFTTLCNLLISIHAPRGGSDDYEVFTALCKLLISIHAPRGGSDLRCGPFRGSGCLFQSTLPAGGATMHDFKDPSTWEAFQSTLPAGGATTYYRYRDKYLKQISIHAPRGGSDRERPDSDAAGGDFNPRSPRGERQQKCMFFMREFIHIP